MRSSRVLVAGFGALLLAGATHRLLAQAPQAGQPQRPTFKTSTELVEVDAVILDKNGKFVPGLKPDDVTVLEDGKPQSIQQFYMVTYNPSGSGAGAAGSNVVSEYADQADYRAHRVFVLLFDEGSLANDSLMRVKLGAEAFIRDQMGPNDAAGVFVNGAMYKGVLTTDRNLLLAGVRSVKPGFDTRPSILAPFRAFPRIPSEVDANRIANGARELVDQLGADACREDPFQCNDFGGLQQVENLIQQKARNYVIEARRLTGQTVQNLQTVTRGLSRIPGRKTVVFMTEGFFVEDSRSVLEMVAAQAARGGTTIYSIDGRGLINGLSANPDVLTRDRARSTVFDTGDDGPTILTAGTGGFMVRNIDDMSHAFGRIVRDTSTYYVIGYAPANSTMNGKVRKLAVTCHVPGVTVRARTSYAAVALPPQEGIWGTAK